MVSHDMSVLVLTNPVFGLTRLKFIGHRYTVFRVTVLSDTQKRPPVSRWGPGGRQGVLRTEQISNLRDNMLISFP
jgi:hypothetical protein